MSATPDLIARIAELEAAVSRARAVAKGWERLAANGPDTYAEIRRHHARELRSALGPKEAS